MAQEDAAQDTPVSSASGHSSPPVEVIAIPPDEDDDFEDGGSIAILDGNEQDPIGFDSYQDPTLNFPCREDHDSWLDAVTKATNYFANRKSYQLQQLASSQVLNTIARHPNSPKAPGVY